MTVLFVTVFYAVCMPGINYYITNILTPQDHKSNRQKATDPLVGRVLMSCGYHYPFPFPFPTFVLTVTIGEGDVRR